MIKEGERNYCFDFIKGFACIFVVFMHCEFPGYTGVFIQSISRFSVPYFFMISGYFCYRTDGTDYKKKIRHIGLIIIGATVFYLIVTPLYQSGFSITFQDLIKWIAFNVPPYIANQLWFLFALLYDYILFSILDKFKLRKFAFFAIPVGIIAYVLLAQGAHLFGLSVPNLLYRNFLIEGFPLFALGFWIHEHQDSISFSNRILILTIAITTMLCPIERLILGRDFGVNIVSFPQVAALFLFAVKNPKIGAGTLINKIGLKYSMYIYIIHPAVMHLLNLLSKNLHFNEVTAVSYLLPILCVILSVLCSALFFKINEMSKRVLSNRQKHKG